jgi:hypothetical protein
MPRVGGFLQRRGSLAAGVGRVQYLTNRGYLVVIDVIDSRNPSEREAL